jgi:hypothetical protein
MPFLHLHTNCPFILYSIILKFQISELKKKWMGGGGLALTAFLHQNLPTLYTSDVESYDILA